MYSIILAQEISPLETWLVEVSIWGNSIWLTLLRPSFGLPDSRSSFISLNWLGFCHSETQVPHVCDTDSGFPVPGSSLGRLTQFAN